MPVVLGEPPRRGSGAQNALLAHRVQQAIDGGAKSATATVAAGSPSARNLQRAGFTALTRRSWQRHPG